MRNMLRLGPVIAADLICATSAFAQTYDTSNCRNGSGLVEIDGVMQPITGLVQHPVNYFNNLPPQ